MAELSKKCWHSTALGLMLCVLAALFAIEAKMAWYLPTSTPTTQISATKLQQADAPLLVAHALSSSDNFVSHLNEVAKVLSLRVIVEEPGFRWRTAETHLDRVIPSSFTPQLFFRPPPSR